MIRLEVKTAQATHDVNQAQHIISAPADGSKVSSFSVLSTPNSTYVLGPDTEWTKTLEKDPKLSTNLAAGHTFSIPGFSIIVTSSKSFAGSRVLYECLAVHTS